VCAGVIVAFQIAKLLQAEGREVRCLVSFDTMRPPNIRDSGGRLITSHLLREAERALKWEKLSASRRAWRRLRRLRWKLLQYRARGWRRSRTARLMYRVRDQFESTPFEGPVDILESEKPENARRIQSTWKHASTSEVRFWPVDGSHRSMWDEKNLRKTASTLMEVLEFRRGSGIR
ncbi:MAG: thioesterase domain-containing protein, partial [Rhodothermia bacterium]